MFNCLRSIIICATDRLFHFLHFFYFLFFLFSNFAVCFSRLLDDYLVLFRKEVEDRKIWIAANENKMSSSYLEFEDLPEFEQELKRHKVKLCCIKLLDLFVASWFANARE